MKDREQAVFAAIDDATEAVGACRSIDTAAFFRSLQENGFEVVPRKLNDAMVDGWNSIISGSDGCACALASMRADEGDPEAWVKWAREAAQRDWDAMLAGLNDASAAGTLTVGEV